jgi:hypothetical protein
MMGWFQNLILEVLLQILKLQGWYGNGSKREAENQFSFLCSTSKKGEKNRY